MGLIFGIIKKLIKLLIYFVIFAAIIVLIPNLPPYTSFTKIDLEPTLPREGPLAPNNELNNIEKLYTDKLLGPECFQLHKGEVYTSLATGEIVKVSPGGHVTFVTQIGKPCAGLKEEQKCGRPLGFVIDEKSTMYVADAYYGIWSVNLNTNKKTLLVSPDVEINGQIPKLFNSVALDSKGNLFYTDSSSEYSLQDGAFSMIADPNGRLFQYNAVKNESKVLLDKLWFPNGIVVSPDDEFIVVAETSAFRLLKYYINGPKKGQKEVLIAGLPGTPDNVRALPGGGLQVALYAAFGEEPLLTRSLAAAPHARKFLLRLQHLAQNALHFLHAQYPHVIFEDAIYAIGHFKSLSAFLPGSSGLLHLDWNGNIVNSFFHTEGQIYVSDAIVFNDKVYLGQPHVQNFIGAIPASPVFKEAFTPKVQKSQVKREAPSQAKPVPQTKPAEPVKTTTPPPAKVTAKAEAPKTTPPPPRTTQPPPPKTTQPPPPKTTQPPPPKTTQPPPKTTQAPTTTPKPPTTAQPPKTTQPPKQTPPPTTTPPPVKSTTPKPAEKKVPATNPSQEKAKAQAKGEKTDIPKPAQKKPAPTEEKAPEQIPIKEEIPSDTIKPSKETLKVIKKGGPAEIPNPEL